MSCSDSDVGLTLDDGVLLYYKYVTIKDVPAIVRWYEDLCSQLKLVGRVRVSSEGVNVTVGGALQALEEHIQSVTNHPGLGECDFKIARCREPVLANPILVYECGFNDLSVRAVKELVSLGNGASHVSHALAGRHLSPSDFHEHLLAAATSQKERGVVILDARNVYETRIGRFNELPGVEFHNPQIRQFSDLPAWLDANEDRLRGKHVYMYCTGGVRCERASAYLRVKGSGFQNVYQLSGGIQRYLEAFPEGGLFAGKNFVFDPRVAVGSLDERKVGRCLVCRSPYDDYGPRCRCSRCRLLVLVCDTCRQKSGPGGHVCELCQVGERGDSTDEGEASPTLAAPTGVPSKLEKGLGTSEAVESIGCEAGRLVGAQQPAYDGSGILTGHRGENNAVGRGCAESSGETANQGKEALSAGPAPRRQLRVLCLHGFRQTGRGLRGRLAAFQRSLQDMVELVFVDGPFELPCLYYPGEGTGDGAGRKQACRRSGEGDAVHPAESQRSVAKEGDVGGTIARIGTEERGHGDPLGERANAGRERHLMCAGPAEHPAVETVNVAHDMNAGALRGEVPDCKAAGRAKEKGDRRRGARGGRSLRGEESGNAASRGPFPKFAWLVSPEQLQGIRLSAEDADPTNRVLVAGSSRDPLREPISGDLTEGIAGLLGVENSPQESDRESVGESGGTSCTARDAEPCERPQPYSHGVKGVAGERQVMGQDWMPACARFGPLQYLAQTAGWDVSLAHLERVFSEQGPFDGVLGFSQGAAAAAALCEHMVGEREANRASPVTFKFAILCSGFASPAKRAVKEGPGTLDVPSLHVFGNVKGNDRQIHVEESEGLAERFEASQRLIVRHSAGHIVPTAKSYVRQYRDFLAKHV